MPTSPEKAGNKGLDHFYQARGHKLWALFVLYHFYPINFLPAQLFLGRPLKGPA